MPRVRPADSRATKLLRSGRADLAWRLPVLARMRAPRFIPPETLVEVMMRTNAERLHLRPSAALNAVILGIIGRALEKYPVLIHAFVILSNHWHALLTATDAKAQADFLRYVHGNIAKAVQDLNGVKGKVWQQRASVLPILDLEAQRERLRYLLSHGTKEHLVASPLLWPGVTSARAMAAGETEIYAEWENRTKRSSLERAARRARARSRSNEPNEPIEPINPVHYMEPCPFVLTPLPVQKHLTVPERAAEVRGIIAEIVAAHPGRCMGVRKVLAQSVMTRPVKPKRTRAPYCHTRHPHLYKRYCELRDLFIIEYRKAALRHGIRPTAASFPVDVFLPTTVFVAVPGTPHLDAMIHDVTALGRVT